MRRAVGELLCVSAMYVHRGPRCDEVSEDGVVMHACLKGAQCAWQTPALAIHDALMALARSATAASRSKGPL